MEQDHPRDVMSETVLLSKKFRAERNFYLCSFTLTLLIIILRFEPIVRNSLKIQEELEQANKKLASKSD
jgi:hypothetical protein